MHSATAESQYFPPAHVSSQSHTQSMAEPSAAKQPPFEHVPPLSAQSRLPVSPVSHAETAYHTPATPRSCRPLSFMSVARATVTAVSPASSSEHAPLASSHVALNAATPSAKLGSVLVAVDVRVYDLVYTRIV